MVAQKSQCPDPESLLELAAGRLSAQGHSELQKHVGECGACLRAFAVAASEGHSLASIALGSGRDDELLLEELRAGQEVGRYIVLYLVGKGGMGQVYAAYDPTLDRKVALKVLHRTGARANQALLAEARTLAKIKHTNVMTIYEVGDLGGRIYLAMEYIDGVSLLEFAEDADEEEILRYFCQAAEGIAAAHELGIVHRDIKPANLLVTDQKNAVVCDFGLASKEKETKKVAGTPGYMAPEQTQGNATAASDQYGLCRSLQVALGADGSRTRKGLGAFFARGMNEDPSMRFRDMSSFACGLQAVLDRPRRVRRWLMVSVLSLIVLGSVVAFLWKNKMEPTQVAACTDAAERFAEIWGETRQVRIGERFASLPGFGTGLWELARQHIDSYERDWVHQRTVSCQRASSKELSAVEYDRRVLCLDRRRREVDRLLGAIAEADTDELLHVLDAFEVVGDVHSCLSIDDEPPLPSAAEAAKSVAELRLALAEIKVALRLGQHDAAQERLRALGTQAEAVGYLPLIAEVALARAGLLSGRLDFESAEEWFRQAIVAGTAGRHDRIVAEAWLGLAFLHGHHMDAFAEADNDLENGRAFLKRVSALGELPMIYERNLGWLRLRQGKPEEAIEHYLLAIELASERKDSERSRDRAMLHSDLGSAYLRAGDIEKAAQELGIAMKEMSALLGSKHPDTLTVHNNYAALLQAEGKFDESIAEFLTILDGFRAVDREAQAAQVLNNLGNLYSDKEDWSKAERTFLEAIETFESAYEGNPHSMVATAKHGLATVLFQQKRYKEAETLNLGSIALKRELLGESHSSIAIGLSSLADIYVAQGRRRDALRVVREGAVISIAALGEEHPQSEYLLSQEKEIKEVGKSPR